MVKQDLAELKALEPKIIEARSHAARDAWNIGVHLARIRREELWRAGDYENFNETKTSSSSSDAERQTKTSRDELCPCSPPQRDRAAQGRPPVARGPESSEVSASRQWLDAQSS